MLDFLRTDLISSALILSDVYSSMRAEPDENLPIQGAFVCVLSSVQILFQTSGTYSDFTVNDVFGYFPVKRFRIIF